SVPLDTARFGVHQSDDRTQQAGLAGAVGATHLKVLTARGGKRQAAQHVSLAAKNMQGIARDSMRGHSFILSSRRPRPADHDSRSAVVTGSRAARAAGSSPPIRPIASAQRTPVPSRGGETSKRKTTWLKFAPSVETA